MKALVFHKPKDVRVDTVPDPAIEEPTVSVVGVYGMPYDNFPLHQWFDKGIAMRGGQVPVHKYIDELIGLVTSGRIILNDIVTHRLSLEEAPRAYDLFNEKEDDCVKVVLNPFA